MTQNLVIQKDKEQWLMGGKAMFTAKSYSGNQVKWEKSTDM